MYAIIAAVPILLTIILMAGFNWPAKKALPTAWAVAGLIAATVWKMGLLEIAAQTLAGFLSALETLSRCCRLWIPGRPRSSYPYRAGISTAGSSSRMSDL